MALYVLPRTAALIEAYDPELAVQLRRFTQVLKNNVQSDVARQRLVRARRAAFTSG